MDRIESTPMDEEGGIELDFWTSEEYWLKRISQLETRAVPNSQAKPGERELSICGAFLKNLGLRFDTPELRPAPEHDAPVHVRFREACFRVKEIDSGKPKRRDFREDLELARQALLCVRRGDPLPPLARPWEDALPISFAGIVTMVVETAKAETHGTKAATPAHRSAIDLLFYVNPMDRFMLPPTERFQIPPVGNLAWRSISFVHAYFSCVLHAADHAPVLFRDNLGRCHARKPAEWFTEQ